jgi:hypothetical protein
MTPRKKLDRIIRREQEMAKLYPDLPSIHANLESLTRLRLNHFGVRSSQVLRGIRKEPRP